ncbi:hypothetical protein FF36_05883 [Frankia torreyi]|uniref:Transglycosylase associated protein n=1 Tax=Frankia torreyi TaxID=1856 RepID=A0A0D8B6E6_9ACTN|nr:MULTISPECIES: hypothetical protein [Frankia]KJE19853.1 hypothetical protein FF36_05883 [Frankia torreyi]KQC36926.1 hypothetical protein UK82_18195 [Frankia sp. ACN1ag]KQM02174.1 hypothetical protein FF86_107821 [Frankia sp. CpI1-P]
MDALTGIISALITGVIIGLLGRAVVPRSRRAPIGCVMTILLGLLGAALGLVVAAAIDAGAPVTLLLQVAIAATLVFLVSAAGAPGRAAGSAARRRGDPGRDRGASRSGGRRRARDRRGAARGW